MQSQTNAIRQISKSSRHSILELQKQNGLNLYKLVSYKLQECRLLKL